jgi:lipopolysaccharide biosynthesis glycosyltransferase
MSPDWVGPGRRATASLTRSGLPYSPRARAAGQTGNPLQTKIYTAYHRPAPRIESASIVPIHVGRALTDGPLRGFEDLAGDDSGETISAKNPAYCELTALWWAWKNDRSAERIGLMHYRRLFDFAGEYRSGAAEIFVDALDIPTWCARSEAWLAANPDVDLVVPPPHVMGLSVEANYRLGHSGQDFDALRRAMAELHPEDLPLFEQAAAGRELRLSNMFVMRRPLFDAYCDWLFGLLERVETAALPRQDYSAQQVRYIGFLAERLFTVYLAKLRRDRPGLKVHQAHILNLSQATVTPWLVDAGLNAPDQVNVAFSADRAYLPHAAAMLRSLADHADPARHYSLFFLHSGIDAAALDLLAGMLAPQRNISLEAIPVGDRFAGAHRSASRAPSNATYNRFLLFDLLPGLDRLLYLDTDMIFRGDVAEIFDQPMAGAKIAAVPDFIMTRTLTGPTPTVDPAVPDLYRYQRQVLGLEDGHIRRYVNAGLILFDFSAMDVAATGRALMQMAANGRYLFRDQDIMNAHFKDDIKVLPARYNVFNTHAEGYGRVPKDNFDAAMAAKADPFVVHFASAEFKPWLSPAVPWAEIYWQALARTPFFGEVVLGPARRRRRPLAALAAAGRALAERLPALKPGLFWVYRGLRRLGGR